VVRSPNGDMLVPAIKQMVKQIDPASGRIVIDPLPGMEPEPRRAPSLRPRRGKERGSRVSPPPTPSPGRGRDSSLGGFAPRPPFGDEGERGAPGRDNQPAQPGRDGRRAQNTVREQTGAQASPGGQIPTGGEPRRRQGTAGDQARRNEPSPQRNSASDGMVPQPDDRGEPTGAKGPRRRRRR
jgi:hypothetical protein